MAIPQMGPQVHIHPTVVAVGPYLGQMTDCPVRSPPRPLERSSKNPNRRGSLKTRTPVPRAATAYRLLLLVPVLSGLVIEGIRSPGTFIHPHPGSFWDVLFWTAVVALVELIPVPVSSALT